jgi:hypothetical protein
MEYTSNILFTFFCRLNTFNREILFKNKMNKVIILVIVCFAIVNGNVKDDLKDKATEALHQGEKVKV